MLGLSLGKLLLLALIIAVVWFGFKYVHRVEAIRRHMREEIGRRRGTTPRTAASVEDLVKCSTCGAYVAAEGATPCGRSDCPWKR